MPFHEFFEDTLDVKGLELLERMSVFDSKGMISRDEWEASGLYRVFAFKKL